MRELPRDRPHIHLHDVGRSQPYTSRQRPQTPPPPARNREMHARTLITALNQALAGAHAQAQARADAPAGEHIGRDVVRRHGVDQDHVAGRVFRS